MGECGQDSCVRVIQILKMQNVCRVSTGNLQTIPFTAQTSIPAIPFCFCIYRNIRRARSFTKMKRWKLQSLH